MLQRRISSLMLTLALGATALTGRVAAQTSDRDKICNQVETRGYTVGKWATYRSTGGQTGGSTLRMAVLSQEPHDGTAYYWYEVSIDDPQHPKSRMIMQMLIPGIGDRVGRVRAVVMKTGDQPAMKMPPQMIQMINSTPGLNISAEIAKGCQQMEAVGWEQVSVPAGQFRALHMRRGGGEGGGGGGGNAMVSEIWVQPDLQFAMVKGILKDGGMMELTGQGTGAKSSITETPVAMPGLPGTPPR